ncbi:MAG: thioether cross-link-forming SCIFF peptide maturase [Lachnospiraceae bacterium]|nr:thioether cross-link-forming SCIFF peptide maturase [Lachnospiraceae bacterium]
MVHQYKSHGFNIVLDVESGAVHIVDDVVYDLIPHMEDKEALSISEASALTGNKYSDTDLEEAINEINELRDSGALYSKDIYESYVDNFTKTKAKEPVVKAMCLHIAHDCNLRCRYCFAEEGEYHGRKALMTYEVGKQALDYLMDHSGNRVNLEVDFFGGEPTMNFDVVKKLVEYGRSREEKRNKKFRFTLTTNGVLLDDEILDFANKEMGNLVLSIDGRKEVNDRMRPTANGKGSYDIILPKFKKAAGSRNQTNYYVRGTYTHYNTDFAKDVIHLNDLGFEQISVEPVVCDPKEDYALKESDLPVLLEQYDILADEVIKRRKNGKYINFFHFMIDLTGGPCIAKRLSGCGSGGEYLSVTPWGDIYPCHQFVGEEKFLMGNVFDGIVNKDITAEFAGCNVYTKPECRECFAKFYCSGGCAANSYHATGSLNGNYTFGCELQRKRIECAIMIKAALAGNEDFADKKESESIAAD